ncbi:MAG: phenylalanine--tRNA ligase subunit beta [Deltaproteobacteria bacterium]|nr:phenylalanine--tRNA ligase subunit beta [Deltaproteobacteria bacterium]
MKISWEWLEDYGKISLSPSELAEVLTHSGLEVESLSEWRPAFQSVIVARLDSFQAHPKNGHLSVCQVYDGQRDYSIVCGAPNLKAGERVALALEGAVLPSGVKIGQAEFQGVPSEGMLCSEQELGLSDDSSGIMFLDPSLPLGVPLEKAMNLGDWIFELNITPNRSDCLCMVGVAREIAALTGQKLRHPLGKKAKEAMAAENQTSVVIERPDLCPRYVAKLIYGIQIAPSPFWMRRRLQAVGVRAINNIVDVTNYVMMEMGQPLHAFDFDRLEQRRIVVRPANPGEYFTTLDGINRPMPDEALMICDGEKPVALAGIMGGLNSEVQPETKNILLESAYFDPMGIRRTSKRIDLTTEASLRFERGIDPNGCLPAAERAASLMIELGGGLAIRGAVDNYPRKIEPSRIFLRAARVNQILGTALRGDEIRDYLQSLELKVEPDGSESFQVIPPTFRVDLLREIDLIEEVARRHGFHRIPVTLPSGRVGGEKKTKIQRAAEQARNLLVACGFFEVINYSFISPKILRDLKLSPKDRRLTALPIQNPLSEDQSVMRTTLIPGLLQVARSNAYRKNVDLKIFELGRAFFPRQGQDLPDEVEVLSGLLTGLREEESWYKSKEECDFFDLRGSLETLLEGLGIFDYRFLPGREEPFLHPGKACQIEIDGNVLGTMGEAHPDVNETFELKKKIYLFELDFQELADRMAERRVFKPLVRYPAITRDVALIVEERTLVFDLLRTFWEANNGLIAEIKLFDLYRGNQIPPGKKSLAFRLKYQREDRTLTDQEVNEFHQKMVDLLVQRHGATLR